MESHIEPENWHFSEKMSEQNVLTTLKPKKYGIEEQVKTIPQLVMFHHPKEKCWEKEMPVLELAVICVCCTGIPRWSC